MPKLYKEIVGIRNKLEKHYKDMQDIEFTIQKGRLWMLQDPNGQAQRSSGDKSSGGNGQRGAHQ